MRSQDIKKLLDQRQFTLDQEPPKEQTVFRIDFQPIGSLGDYILFTGRPKAGKSKYLSGAMAAAISQGEVFRLAFRLPENKRRVVHFDTEQGKRSHYYLLELTRRLMDADVLPENFHSYHCRQDSPRQIIAMIEYFVKSNDDTGVVFIDGLLDVIDSFNDEKASKALVNWLKMITEKYNVLIVGVLHRSLSNDKSIGHLGSTADRAAQSVLIVEKNKDTKQYVLRAEYLRDCDEFKPIAIWYNKNLNIWEETEYIDEATQGALTNPGRYKARPADYEDTRHMANIATIFKRGNPQQYKQLIQNIIEVYGVGRTWAVECVTYLQQQNLLYYTDEGYSNAPQAKLFIYAGDKKK